MAQHGRQRFHEALLTLLDAAQLSHSGLMAGQGGLVLETAVFMPVEHVTVAAHGGVIELLRALQDGEAVEVGGLHGVSSGAARARPGVG